MKKFLIVLFCLGLVLSSYAIDIYKPYIFNPQEIVGKTILIPTYNGGDNVLHLAYTENVLHGGELGHQNYFNEKVLGHPIRILDYKILNQGKKDEVLCLVSEVKKQKFVLCFPMNIRKDDHDGKLIAELFYGKPIKETMSYALYSIDDINLNYYLSDSLTDFENKFKDKKVYLCGDDYVSQKEYTFEGFKFIKRDKEFKRANKEWKFWPYSSIKRQPVIRRNNLDDNFAILKGEEYTVYVKIKGNNIKPTDEDCVAMSGLAKLFLNEPDYKASFAQSYDNKRLNVLKDTLTQREFFFAYNKNLTGACGMIGETTDFSPYKSLTAQNLGNHYVRIDSISQKKCFNDKKVCFYYFAIGKGTEDGVFDKPVALLLNDNILRQLNDGPSHREKVRLAELQRQKENQERIAQQEREDREYRNILVRKYGAANAKLIMNGEVRIGFTKQMCEEAWGEPQYINNTISSYAKWEQWVYGLGTYLYFSGNKLVVIQY